MGKMFGGFSDWSIDIFYNILLLADSEVNAARNWRIFLKKCAEHNVFLEPSKCWVGFPSVSFFDNKMSYRR